MNEMVERVAFHLRAAGGIVNPEENSLILARVAIEAMREPTEAMVAAVNDENDCYLSWQQMIDEALK